MLIIRPNAVALPPGTLRPGLKAVNLSGMSKPAPKPVTIPRTELGRDLDEAAAIKRKMAALLRELEAQAAGRPVKQTGAWRHHPADWPPPPNAT